MLLFKAVAAVFLFLPLASAATPAIWPVDSLIKVFPEDAVGTHAATSAILLLPRNGHASLQFAIRANQPLSELNVVVHLAAPIDVQVRRVGYVPVRMNTPQSRPAELVHKAPSHFPDPLLEDLPFSIPANETHAVWITLHAVATATPGDYLGSLTFLAGKQTVGKQTIRVRVAHAVVPPQTLRVSNWFNLDQEHLSRFFTLQGDSERYWGLLANIARVMSDYRQNAILTPVLSLTDGRISDGQVVYDFSRLDRWLEIFGKYRLTGTIEGGHLLDRENGYRSALIVPVFVIENGQIRRASVAPDDPRADAHMNSFLPALYRHLRSKGLQASYVQHILDEAHGTEPPAYKHFAALVRKHMPGIRTIDAINDPASPVAADCDIWVPILGRFDDRLAAIRDHVNRGGGAWFYTCVYPQGDYMNRFIDYPLLKTRLLHWFNFRHGLTGYLHWGGNFWDGDPYENTEVTINAGQDRLPAGDAFITYPWRRNNSIHASIRLEAMREGIEDYELLRAAEARNPARAREIVKEAVPNTTDYIRDVGVFRRLHQELLSVGK